MDDSRLIWPINGPDLIRRSQSAQASNGNQCRQRGTGHFRSVIKQGPLIVHAQIASQYCYWENQGARILHVCVQCDKTQTRWVLEAKCIIFHIHQSPFSMYFVC